jgi:hypothetical protein
MTASLAFSVQTTQFGFAARLRAFLELRAVLK